MNGMTSFHPLQLIPAGWLHQYHAHVGDILHSDFALSNTYSLNHNNVVSVVFSVGSNANDAPCSFAHHDHPISVLSDPPQGATCRRRSNIRIIFRAQFLTEGFRIDFRLKNERSTCILVLSPRIEPLLRADEGSMAMTATRCPAPRRNIPKASIKLDFPTPGDPFSVTLRIELASIFQKDT